MPTDGELELMSATSASDQSDAKVPVAAVGSFSGTAISVVLHLWLLVTCASITLASRDTTPVAPVETRFTPVEPLEEPEQILEYELANPRDEEFEVRKVVNARSIGASQPTTTQPKAAPVPQAMIEIPVPQFRPAEIYDISEGEELDDRVNLKGRSGEQVVQIESALDRISWEIASHLQERKVLVVWLLDASGSLQEQRNAIAKRLRRVYGELGALAQAGELIPRTEKGLLSGVAMFGEKITFLTQVPTDDVDKVIQAVQSGPIDNSGVENTFFAVEQVVKKWSSYRAQGRSILVMTITDEAGDDFSQHLETSIHACNRIGAKVYCVGPAAIFGKRQAFVPYTAPEDNKEYKLPVDMGPETPMMEYVQLPFWFDGPQFDNLSAGIGPYALSRLVKETGGVYFLSNMTTTSALSPLGVFSVEAMRPFEPDYRFGKLDDYQRDLNKHPLRRAVVQAAQISLSRKAQGTPDLDLRVTPNNYLQTLGDSQRSAAETTLMVDLILQPFAAAGKLEDEYQKEPSARWKAAYNLTYGRLLALKVRAYEYNYACAQLKQLGTGDVATKSNHWIFRPDAQLGSGATMKKLANESERLLKRCVNEAPGTPWALLASRELQYPLGIQVVQRFIPPAPPPQMAAANATKTARFAPENQKRPMPPKKPEPPPKPPALPKL
jgi:hypothetical protein